MVVMSRSNPAATLQRTTGRIMRPCSSAIFAFSPDEEEFFRVGDAMAEASGDFRDLDADDPKPSLWRAMVDWLRGARTQYAE
jgi:hypothetical protein